MFSIFSWVSVDLGLATLYWWDLCQLQEKGLGADLLVGLAGAFNSIKSWGGLENFVHLSEVSEVYFCHFIFPWWPVYGKWQHIRLHSCLKQPQTRLCAGSHAVFLLFLGCAGGGILLTLREEYLFSSIPMESFSICSAAHQRSSFFQMTLCW